jgi:hypothetical protein
MLKDAKLGGITMNFYKIVLNIVKTIEAPRVNFSK